MSIEPAKLIEWSTYANTILANNANFRATQPYAREIADAQDMSAETALAHGVLALMDELDRVRLSVLQPMTAAQVEAALIEGRIERRAAEGDHAFVSLLRQRTEAREALSRFRAQAARYFMARDAAEPGTEMEFLAAADALLNDIATQEIPQ